MSEILELLSHYEARSYPCWCPVIQATIDCEEVSVEQRRHLLDLTVQSTSPGFQQNRETAISTILSTNIKDTNITTEVLTRYDRHAIFLQLHAAYELNDTEKWCNHIKNVAIPGRSSIVSSNNIKCALKVPTIAHESKVFKDFHQILSNDSDNPNIISNTVLYTLATFMESIDIGDKHYNLYEMNGRDIVEIIRSLPMSLFNQIKSFASTWRSYEKALCSPENDEIDVDISFISGFA